MKMRYNAGEVITAMVTPFDKNLNVDYSAVEKLANHLVNNGSDGILVAGTTGESPTLTHEEELELLKVVKSTVSGKAKVIMGAGSNSTLTAVEMSKKVEKAGADAILTVVPYYNKPSKSGIVAHFSEIAKAVDLPIILYNIPGRTGINMLPETVAELANKYKNIVAIKQSMSDMDAVSELYAQTPDDFAIYSGDDSLTLPMMSLGAYGVISVASHVFGNDIKSMITNFKNGNVLEATTIHQKLFPIFKKLFMAPNPIPVKAVLSHIGIVSDDVRLPLVKLTDAEKSELLDVYNSLG